jgi:hypothetical protein
LAVASGSVAAARLGLCRVRRFVLDDLATPLRSSNSVTTSIPCGSAVAR